MLPKIIVIVFVLLILFCLGSALVSMLSRQKNPQSAVSALTWRISLSVILFLWLLLSFYMGWIHPHGL